MPARPNLLLVSYFYPPCATGVRRVVSLVRHLPEQGWRPIVLTAPPVAGAGHDAGPLDDPIVAATPVIRAESWDPYRLAAWWREGRRPAEAPSAAGPARAGSGWGPRVMAALRAHAFVPDDRCGWIPMAVQRGVEAVRRHRLRAVYSTNYPQSAHVVAWRIAARTGVPWIAEFRDGWTQNPAFFAPGNPVLRALQHDLERRVARAATAVITVSPPISRHLQRLRGAATGRLPAVTIYNGFESAAAPAAAAEASPLTPGRRTLLYTGTFFGRRRPDAFLAGLAWAMRRDRALAARWCVWLRAELDDRARDLIGRWGLADVVRVLPPVAFAQCAAEQARADACLLVLEHGPGADIMVSQKVFEYLATRRPIFALVPVGAAAELLAETGGAAIATTQQPARVGPELAAFFAQVEAGTLPPARESVLARFDRREQTAAIADVIRRAVSLNGQ